MAGIAGAARALQRGMWAPAANPHRYKAAGEQQAAQPVAPEALGQVVHLAVGQAVRRPASPVKEPAPAPRKRRCSCRCLCPHKRFPSPGCYPRTGQPPVKSLRRNDSPEWSHLWRGRPWECHPGGYHLGGFHPLLCDIRHNDRSSRSRLPLRRAGKMESIHSAVMACAAVPPFGKNKNISSQCR